MEYVLNVSKKKAHIKPTQEICNADQIIDREESQYIPTGYTLCGHCKKRAALSV